MKFEPALLFDGEAARTAAGAYVPLVLWFNFIAGFAYVITGAQRCMDRHCSAGSVATPAAARFAPRKNVAPNCD